MSIAIPFAHDYRFTVGARLEDVFALLADVPASASHFPKLARLVDLGDNSYRWEMEKVGTAQFNIQTIYAARYVSNRTQGSIRWTPVDGVGNATISGEWRITRVRQKTQAELLIQGELHVPLPGLMRRVVAPIVEAENHKLIGQYVANLEAHFDA